MPPVTAGREAAEVSEGSGASQCLPRGWVTCSRAEALTLVNTSQVCKLKYKECTFKKKKGEGKEKILSFAHVVVNLLDNIYCKFI